MTTTTKNTVCLWYDRDAEGGAEAAARFYARTFPDSAVGAVHRAPADFPGGRAGDVLTGRVHGVRRAVPRPQRRAHVPAQRGVLLPDRHRRSGGDRPVLGRDRRHRRPESACGWCQDRWGLSWQITPRVLTAALARGGDVARRAFEAMMPMRKIDVATIEEAVRGGAVPA
jgi:predicted 3-demethylubiquinone-9 3-methyltransferase (glyoxalase superfamily)